MTTAIWTVEELLKIRPAIDLFYGLSESKENQKWVERDELEHLLSVFLRCEPAPTIILTAKVLEFKIEDTQQNHLCFDGYVVDKEGARFLFILSCYLRGYVDFSPVFRLLQANTRFREIPEANMIFLTTPFKDLPTSHKKLVYSTPIEVGFSDDSDKLIGIQNQYPIMLQ